MSRAKNNTLRKLYRRTVRVRSLEPFGIERGDVAIIAADGDIKTGELGFFSLAHWHSGDFDQFAFVCEPDRTCFQLPDAETGVERLCYRSELGKCRGLHVAELYGRVIAVERKGLSVGTTLALRAVDEYTAPPPSTAPPKRTPPTFRLNDLHHETGREIFWQFDATLADLESNAVVKFPTHILCAIEQRLNNLAHQYGLDRETFTKEKIYLAACRSRYVETKGTTSHNNDIDSIICAVMRQRRRAPEKPEPPKANAQREPQETINIPAPVFSKSGEKYETVSVNTNTFLHAAIPKGCKFIVKVGALRLVELHAFRVSDGVFVGELTKINGDEQYIKSIVSDSRPSGWYTTKEAARIGCVVEYYPQGFSGARWVLWNGDVKTDGANTRRRAPKPRHVADDEKQLEELRRKLRDLDEDDYPREGERFALEKEIYQLEHADEWQEVIEG